MRVALLHDVVGPEALPDDLDILAQLDSVSGALAALGHEPFRIPCTLNLEALAEAMHAGGPDLVFNLVESLGGHGRLLHLPPTLLDVLRIPYTGSTAEAIATTSNKPLAKMLMAAAGLPTPPWISGARGRDELPARMIVKSAWEHASRGLDDDSIIVPESLEHVREEIRRREHSLGGEAFAEAFVDGREFNISILAGGLGCVQEVLPAAEIRFENFGDRPRIVGYAAKWETDSPEYAGTVRSFEVDRADVHVVEEMRQLALRAWAVFGLRGWARVDFRLDEVGRPWILEINANPSLSPDAGFAAAVERAGISYADAIGRILADVPRAAGAVPACAT